MNPAMDNEFQQWLSQINQVCGNFTGRLLTERYTGVLDTHFAKGLKLSTVTTSGVNLSRTWQEVKGSDDAWFYTVFQLSGQAIMEQMSVRCRLALAILRYSMAHAPVRFTGRSLLNRFHYFCHALCWNNIFPIKNLSAQKDWTLTYPWCNSVIACYRRA